MIVRIVKMTFNEENVNDFLQLFESKNQSIRSFEGCKRLELLQDDSNPEIFFTYSFWTNEDYLEQYRKSDLFQDTWKITKSFFKDKPQAWSTKQKYILA